MTGHTVIDGDRLTDFRYDADVDEYEGHIYVIRYATPRIKVGFTKNATYRIRSHVRAAKSHGVEVAAVWLSAPHVGAEANERALKDFCNEAAGEYVPGEYFTGVTYTAAIAFAETLPYQAVDIRTPAWRAEVQRRDEDKRLIERIKAGDFVVVPRGQHEAMCEAALRAKDVDKALRRVIGKDGLSIGKLPARLRRAADQLEKHPRRLGEQWWHLLPDVFTEASGCLPAAAGSGRSVPPADRPT